jgi:hypothetical protein
LLKAIRGGLELHLRLPPETPNLITGIDGDQFPIEGAKLAKKCHPSSEPTFLVFEAGAAARLDVAVLIASNNECDLRDGPALVALGLCPAFGIGGFALTRWGQLQGIVGSFF